MRKPHNDVDRCLPQLCEAAGCWRRLAVGIYRSARDCRGLVCDRSFFQYSDTWQLVINTGTTIVTFLMVFLIQNTQNRDAKAIHLKLDELIRSVKGARNTLIDLEELSEEELDDLQRQFVKLRRRR